MPEARDAVRTAMDWSTVEQGLHALGLPTPARGEPRHRS